MRKARQGLSQLEFLRWQLYMLMEERDDWNKPHRADFHTAILAQRIYLLQRRVDGLVAPSPMPALPTDDRAFLFKCELAEPTFAPKGQLTAQQRYDLMMRSSRRAEAAWAGYFGVGDLDAVAK